MQQRKGSLEIFLAAIGVIVSLVALFISWQANRIAREANAIALEQQRPKIAVVHQFTYQRYADAYADPCMSEYYGYAVWDTEFAAAFDLNNTGGAPLSLTRVEFPERSNVAVPVSDITAYAWLSFFNNRDDLRQWYYEKDGPPDETLLPSIEQSVATGTPIKVEAYSTVRLMLRGFEQVSIDQYASAQEIHDQIRAGDDWTANIRFVFADGTTSDVDFAVARPYSYWEPGQVSLPSFPPCERQTIPTE